MKTVEITTSAASQKYSITIGSNIIDHITDYVDFEGYSSIMIISDSHVSTIYLAKLVDALRKQVLKEHIHSHIFEPGEKNKTLATVQKMSNAFLDSGLDSMVIAKNIYTDINFKNKSEEMEKIIKYNEIDCLGVCKILDCLRLYD